jgi:DNA-binding winged helix-turn-helix (wHTH) protein/Tol biopolymer transport system component
MARFGLSPDRHQAPMASSPDKPALMDAEQLRVGDYVLDLARRELSGPAHPRPIRLTVKTQGVLLALAMHAGKVVSREALLKHAWPDTLPTDDVVTQAVTSLRRAFADDGEVQRYIETIPKTGYRLRAPVEWSITPPESYPEPAIASPAPGPASGAWRIPDLHLAGYFVLAVILLAAVWQQLTSGPADAQASPPQVVAITSLPGDESDPSLSPDGSLVAYSGVPPGGLFASVFVQSTSAVPATRMTDPPEGSVDIRPRWSPDGRQLVFVRCTADLLSCQFMRVPASGGSPTPVARCYIRGFASFDWLPDSSGIVAPAAMSVGKVRGGFRILKLATGQWEELPYTRAKTDVDVDPRFSPDGKWLGFRKNPRASEFWVVPSRGGSARRISILRGDVRGWDWAPDGRSIIFSYVRGEAGLYRLAISNGKVSKIGVADALFPDIADDAPVMVFTTRLARSSIVRMPWSGLRTTEPGEQLFASSSSDMMPSPSPNQEFVAYYSDRSGSLKLWIGELVRPESAKPIDGFTPALAHPPQWSVDGSYIYAVGYMTDSLAESAEQLVRINVPSGRAVREPLGGLKPSYAEDIDGTRLMAMLDHEGARPSMSIIDTSTTPISEIARLDDVAIGHVDQATRSIFFVRNDSPGLWRTDFRLNGATRIDADGPAAPWLRRWTVGGGRAIALLATTTPQCGTAAMALGSREPGTPVCIDALRQASGGPQLSNDGSWLYLTLPVGEQGSDIGMVDVSFLKQLSD